MAETVGRCTNFGNCTTADEYKAIPLAVGQLDANCPTCGKPLTIAQARGRRIPIIPVASLFVGALVLIALVLPRVLSSPRTAPIATASPRPNVTAASAPAGDAGTVVMRLCGSNTIGTKLGPDLIAAFERDSGHTPTISDRGVDEKLVSWSQDGKTESVLIGAHRSATAFTGLRAGTCDVGMASRRIAPTEIASLQNLGRMTAPASEHIIGLDGIAVIVNPQNPVSQLSVAQLRAIYVGAASTWSGFHGRGPIAVVARDDKSGTYDMFKTLVLEETPLVRGARRFEDSAALSSAVSADARAIGFVGLPYVGRAKALAIAAGGSAIMPTVETVGRESYPLTRRLYLYTAANPTNALVQPFVKFVESEGGQQVVNQDAFVGVTTQRAATRNSSKSLLANAPFSYRKLLETMDQASFNLYFQTGSDALDNKALIDVGRLIAVLGQRGQGHNAIVLAGFADSTGDPNANLVLSQHRAAAVGTQLSSLGVDVRQSLGFGAALPIRDNATESGREKNRRVEIFISR